MKVFSKCVLGPLVVLSIVGVILPSLGDGSPQSLVMAGEWIPNENGLEKSKGSASAGNDSHRQGPLNGRLPSIVQMSQRQANGRGIVADPFQNATSDDVAQQSPFQTISETSVIASEVAETEVVTGMEAEVALLKQRLDQMSWQQGPVADACCTDELPCDCTVPGTFIGVDWLSWTARRRGLDYAHVADSGGLSALGSKNRRLTYDRNGGFRFHYSRRKPSGWELAFHYTYFHSNDAESKAPRYGVIPTRIHPGDAPSNVAASASANASLDMDVLDFEVGRWFHPNCWSAFRVFGGFRWAIIDQDFNVTYNGGKDFGSYNNHTVSTPSKMDGYGLRIGSEGHWKLGRGWSLFGRSAGSVLGGQFENRYLERDDTYGLLTDVRDHVTQAVPVMEVAAGLGYRKGTWEFSLGYELATWFNMADRPSFTSAGLASGPHTNDTSDLLIDGLFLQAGFTR